MLEQDPDVLHDHAGEQQLDRERDAQAVAAENSRPWHWPRPLAGGAAVTGVLFPVQK